MVHEKLWESIAKDVVSAAALLGTVGVGIWINAPALQWCAGVVWVLWVIGHSASSLKNNTYSFDAARKRLDEWERE